MVALGWCAYFDHSSRADVLGELRVLQSLKAPNTSINGALGAGSHLAELKDVRHLLMCEGALAKMGSVCGIRSCIFGGLAVAHRRRVSSLPVVLPALLG